MPSYPDDARLSRSAHVERRPLERPAQAFPGLVTLPPRPGARPLFTRHAPLARATASQTRGHAPDAIRSALLRVSVPPTDFCNVDDARTRLRAFDPRPRGGEAPTLPPRPLSRAGVRLPRRWVAPSASSEPQHLYKAFALQTACAVKRCRGPRKPSKGAAPLGCKVPPLTLLEHPRHRRERREGPEPPSLRFALAKIQFWCRPAKDDTAC